jgi:hypothetical protein
LISLPAMGARTDSSKSARSSLVCLLFTIA